jgi:hypothetical protein
VQQRSEPDRPVEVLAELRARRLPETVDALKIVAAVNQAGSGMGVGPAG